MPRRPLVLAAVLGALAAVPASAAAAPVAVVVPDALDFREIGAGAESAPWPVVVQNQGDDALHVSGLRQRGTGRTLFAISDDRCSGATLQPGERCGFDVRFAPQREGSWTTSIDVLSDAPTVSATLTGRAVAPFEVVVAGADLGWVAKDEQSGTATVELRSLAAGTLTVSEPRIEGAGRSQFRIEANTCSGAVRGSCSMEVRLVPTGVGAWSPTLRIPTSGGTATVTLHGEGVPAVDADPGRMDFGAVGVGGSSGGQWLDVRNNSTFVPIRLTSVGLAGRGQSLFSVDESGCGDVIAPREHCTLWVTFAPTLAGSWTPALEIATWRRTFVVPLSGSGV